MTDNVGTLTDNRWTRWAACAGVLFVLLLAVSFFLINTPNTGDSAAKISHYYLTHKVKTNLTGLLTYLSVFFGVWFYTWIWRYFRSFPGLEVPAAVSLVGAILFAASGTLSAGINFAFADHTKQLNDGALVALNQLDNNVTYPMTIVGLALFYSATTVVIFRARAFPRWLGWVSGVLALAALIPFIAFFAFLATGLWVLIVCFLVWRIPGRSSAAQGSPIVS